MNAPRSQDVTSQRHRGWHSRGYLPHFDAGQELPQFVTFRLADSMPAHVVASWQEELLAHPETERDAALHRMIKSFIDSGYGACHLQNPQIGAIVETAILFFDAERYRIHAWVVMPNHVHTLFTPEPGYSLSDILGSWKSFTSKEANKLLGRTGKFWQEDYFDRYVRNEYHFQRVVWYIENNPVNAGLCTDSSDWLFGSSRLIRKSGAAETAAIHGENP